MRFNEVVEQGLNKGVFMANQNLNQLFTIFQDLREHSTNLHKDLDDNDEREETQGDLANMFKSFNDLRALMSKVEQSDVTKLQSELKRLLSGEESLTDYQHDVANILSEVRKRTEQENDKKDKIADNLPPQHQNQNVNSIFDNWGSILSNVQHWIEQNASQVGR